MWQPLQMKKAKQRPGSSALGRLHGGVAPHGAGQERRERWEGQGCTQGFKDEMAAVHGWDELGESSMG